MGNTRAAQPGPARCEPRGQRPRGTARSRPGEGTATPEPPLPPRRAPRPRLLTAPGAGPQELGPASPSRGRQHPSVPRFHQHPASRSRQHPSPASVPLPSASRIPQHPGSISIPLPLASCSPQLPTPFSILLPAASHSLSRSIPHPAASCSHQHPAPRIPGQPRAPPARTHRRWPWPGPAGRGAEPAGGSAEGARRFGPARFIPARRGQRGEPGAAAGPAGLREGAALPLPGRHRETGLCRLSPQNAAWGHGCILRNVAPWLFTVLRTGLSCWQHV